MKMAYHFRPAEDLTVEITPNLNLPFIMPSQAQKHVTHNEAIRALDAIVQLSVVDNSHTSPPASIDDGHRYIVAENATGEWAGKEDQIAAWQDGSWTFYSPATGWLCWVEASSILFAYDGQSWLDANAETGDTSLVGINATANTTNRLTVASPASLFDHEGSGHQLKLNKATSNDTGSLLFQTDYTGHAEIGLAGDNNLHLKVSADGTAWKEAIQIDSTTGVVSLPQSSVAAINPNILINGDFQINQRGFAGGSLANGSYGFDRWKADGGAADLSLSGYALTLNSGVLSQFVEPAMAGTDNLADSVITISIEDPSSDMLVFAGSNSETLTEGAGRRSVTITTAPSDTGNLQIKIAKANAGVVTFGRIKVEVGPSPTPWSARLFPEEFNLCQRYFQTTVPTGQAPDNYAPNAGNGSIYALASSSSGSVTVIRLPAPMRTNPSVTVRDGAANVGKISAYLPGSGWINDYGFTGVLGLTDKGFSLQQNNTGIYNISFDYTADAEI